MTWSQPPNSRRMTVAGPVVLLAAIALCGLILAACSQSPAEPAAHSPPVETPQAEKPQAQTPRELPQPKSSKEDPQFVEARRRMVERDLRGRDIKHKRVLEAMGRVARQRFVPEKLRPVAYTDGPLPIGHRQTISQPYIVALMTQLVQPKAKSRALDVGTGSGYQAAVLAELCKEVYSIEIVKPLAVESKKRLAALGYKNVTVRYGDGYRGWPKHAPFDVIVVAAAPDHVPQALVDQLAPGGRLVIPVGRWYQELMLIEKRKDGTLRRKSVAPVAFVPMTGEAEKQGKE